MCTDGDEGGACCCLKLIWEILTEPFQGDALSLGKDRDTIKLKVPKEEW
jgi:hypothetical protein